MAKNTNKTVVAKDNVEDTEKSTTKRNPQAKKSLSIRAGVDLGTANTLVYIEGHGVIFNEPSVVAYDISNQKVICVGIDAFNMIGKTHHNINIVKPLVDGVISDVEAATELLKVALSKLEHVSADLSTSTLLICCPSELTPIEREAIKDLTVKLGMKDVFIEEEVKAGAIGAGIDIFNSKGSLVLDIGGGSTDIGVLSLGDIVVSESLKVAGNYFDKEIIKYIQYKHSLVIGHLTAERIKKEIGSLILDPEVDTSIWIAGRDLVNGMPRKLELFKSEIARVLTPGFEDIAATTFKVLQVTPPELSADIMRGGVIVNGGGALFEGVGEFFANELGLKVAVSANPLTAICEGTKMLLKHRGNYIVNPD